MKEFLRPGSLPPAGMMISPLRRQKQTSPEYDDFMNSVFSYKLNKSYMLRQKADLRTAVLQPKLKFSLNQNAADDDRIMADYGRQLEKNDKAYEERKNRRI